TAVDPRSDPALGSSATAPTPSQLFGERHTRSATRTGGVPAIRDTGGFPAIRDTGPMPRLGPDRIRVEEAGEHVAQKWILTRGRDNIRDLLPGPILPPVIDKELLVDAEKELGLSLRPYQEAREWLRDAFWARGRRPVGMGPGGGSGAGVRRRCGRGLGRPGRGRGRPAAGTGQPAPRTGQPAATRQPAA